MIKQSLKLTEKKKLKKKKRKNHPEWQYTVSRLSKAWTVSLLSVLGKILKNVSMLDCSLTWNLKNEKIIQNDSMLYPDCLKHERFLCFQFLSSE